MCIGRMKLCRQKGFTLIEVLVALLIMAISIGAAIKTGGQSVDIHDSVSKRMFAHWIAEEVIEDFRLKKLWPLAGKRNFKTEGDNGNTWNVQVEVFDTLDADLRKLTVYVSADNSRNHHKKDVAKLNAYLINPDR